MEAAVYNAPVILELGRASRKRIRDLKQGRGPLLEDIQDAMTEVTTTLGEQASGKQLIPVVLLYRKKSRRRRSVGGFLPLC